MRKKIIAANWKMNLHQEEALTLASELTGQVGSLPSGTEILLFPPFLYIKEIAGIVKRNSSIFVGAQNCHTETKGAYTGEISASMLQSVGASHVIVGHSERRQYYNEDAETLRKKTEAAFNASLQPVFCMGETMDERRSGNQQKIVSRQIEESLFHLSGSDFANLILAYEPVWAIGTGVTASSAQAQEMHLAIRQLIAKKYGEKIASQISILYGGSCNAENATELFSMNDIDGGLIGGASLKIKDFLEIVRSI